MNSVSCFISYEYVRLRPNGGCISVTACTNDNFLRLARGAPSTSAALCFAKPCYVADTPVTGCPLSKLLPFIVLYAMFVLACVLLNVYRLVVRHASMACGSVVLL
jgi:hypothetical protein